jgi:hypothetical protein
MDTEVKVGKVKLLIRRELGCRTWWSYSMDEHPGRLSHNKSIALPPPLFLCNKGSQIPNFGNNSQVSQSEIQNGTHKCEAQTHNFIEISILTVTHSLPNIVYALSPTSQPPFLKSAILGSAASHFISASRSTLHSFHSMILASK